MDAGQADKVLRIGELAACVGTTADTVRYYEQLGLLEAPTRSDGGYRLYGQVELGRLQFIRRAKSLGLSLGEIKALLGLAQQGECRPLRKQVAELLRHKLEECDQKLQALAAFKASLEVRYQLALQSQEELACSCATFPASCACLPVSIEEVRPRRPDTTWPRQGRTTGHQFEVQEETMDTQTTGTTERERRSDAEELRVLNAGCGCGCDGSCGCGGAKAQAAPAQSCGCGCSVQRR